MRLSQKQLDDFITIINEHNQGLLSLIKPDNLPVLDLMAYKTFMSLKDAIGKDKAEMIFDKLKLTRQ